MRVGSDLEWHLEAALGFPGGRRAATSQVPMLLVTLTTSAETAHRIRIPDCS